MGDSDPDPAVECSAPHTSVTVGVAELEDAPDWHDYGALWQRVNSKCMKGELDLLGEHPKVVQSSAYSMWLFIPSKAQRQAGAKWVRCDIALAKGTSLRPLATDGPPELGSLPLDDDLALCRRGKAQRYLVVACSGAHALRAIPLIRRPGAYPGDHRMELWTQRHCVAKLGRRLGFYEWPTRTSWRLGERYSTCFKTTTS
jgi:hypothetical protein